MKEKHITLVGQKIKNLLIVDIFHYYRGKSKDYKAKVFCDLCKKERIMLLRTILYGKIKSCGCLRYKTRQHGLENKLCHDLRGKKFGMLAPIELNGTSPRGVSWKCQCDCGQVKIVPARNLVGKRTLSCGCQHYITGKNNPLWKGYEEISGGYWGELQRGAKQRNIDFFITIERAWKMFLKQNRNCALTGQPLIFKSKFNVRDGNASLDRIDSKKGYVEGNIQWVDKKINTLKWNFDLDNFLRMCKLVVDHNKL